MTITPERLIVPHPFDLENLAQMFCAKAEILKHESPHPVIEDVLNKPLADWLQAGAAIAQADAAAKMHRDLSTSGPANIAAQLEMLEGGIQKRRNNYPPKTAAEFRNLMHTATLTIPGQIQYAAQQSEMGGELTQKEIFDGIQLIQRLFDEIIAQAVSPSEQVGIVTPQAAQR